MNKKILIAAVLSLLLLLGGCGSTIPAEAPAKMPSAAVIKALEEAEETAKTEAPVAVETVGPTVLYDVKTETYSENNINVEYPQIMGLSDEVKQQAINDLIKNTILDNQVFGPIEDYRADMQDIENRLSVDMTYEVMLQTDELLSVRYTGVSNVEGAAHPTNNIDAITIDIKNAAKLALTDFVAVDKNFVRQIKETQTVTHPGLDYGDSMELVIAAIRESGDAYIIGGLLEQWPGYTYYLTPDALVISIGIFHAVGDYALVELPGQYAKP